MPRSPEREGSSLRPRGPFSSIGIVSPRDAAQRKSRREQPSVPSPGRGAAAGRGGYRCGRVAAQPKRCLRQMQRGGAGAAVCFLQAGHVPRRKSRAPQPGLGKNNPPAEKQTSRHRIRREAEQLYRSLRNPQDVSWEHTATTGIGSEQRFKGR